MLGFSDAVLLYITSSYFKAASGVENVGGFYLAAYAVLLLVMLNLHKLTRRLGNVNTFLFTILAKVIVIALLARLEVGAAGVFLMIAYVILAGMEWVSLDSLLENFSCDRESGRIRGKHLMILNTGFLLGPFLSTQLLERFSFSGVFIFLVLFNILIFLFDLIKLRNVTGGFRNDVSVTALVKKVSQRKNVLAIYYVAFILDFFYALMVIYTPIYLLDLGLDWERIGVIFTIMLIPFVILQYPVGILADRKTGEKHWLVVAVSVMAFFTASAFFIGTPSILVWSLVLFGTRVGAAMIEVLRDSYFYKQIDGGDTDLIGFFRTSASVAYIMAAFVSSVVLLFLPLRSIFLVLALVVVSAIVPIASLTRNGSGRSR